jgi:AraC family transcriptional regulator
MLDDADIGRVRRGGSQVNIRADSLRCLAQYALARLRTRAPFGLFETQSLASLVYIETIRSLGGAGEPRRRNLADREFAAVCAIIDAELGSSLTCAQIAATANIPLRVIFDGIRLRTGMSLYRFVIERRLARARQLLVTSAAPIAEIALACGFSSQQHLTSVFSDKVGRTPLQIRRQA